MTSTVDEPGPHVSVIVACSATTAGHLRRCLRSLIEQDAPGNDYEILVVTAHRDGSDAAVAKALISANPTHRLRVLDSRVDSVGGARNVGLEHIRGEHVLFVDAHDTVSPDYVSALVAAADGISMPLAGIVSIRHDGTRHEDEDPASGAATDGDAVEITHSATHPADAKGKLYPRSWIEDVRFDESLEAGHDAVFNARVFLPFSRRFARGNRAPRRAGARYYRHLSGVVPLQQSDYSTVVKPRLDVLRLLARLDQDPRNRVPLISALLHEQAGSLAGVLEEHATLRRQTEQDLSTLGLRDVDVFTTANDRWPGYGTLMGRAGPDQPQRVAIVSGTTEAIVARRQDIAFLRAHKIDVVGGFLTGAIGTKFPDIEWCRLAIIHEQPAAAGRRAASGTMRSRLSRVDRISRKIMRRAALQLVPLPVLAGYVEPANRRALTLFDRSPVVALDEAGETAARVLDLRPHPAAWLDGQVLATAAVAARISVTEAKTVARAATALATLPSASVDRPSPQVWTLAALRLIRNARRTDARQVLHAAQSAFPGASATHGFELLHLLVDVLENGQLTSGFGGVCEAVMAEADRLYALGAADHGLFLMQHTIEVLLHPEVHANVADPPLIRTPETLLAPLAGSEVWRDLSAPIEGSRTSWLAHKPSKRPSVLVLPGAYPKFTAPVQNALEGYADTEVLTLTDFASHYGNTNPAPSLLALRHAAARGEPLDVEGDIAEAFANRDVIFADWADKGAMLASLFAPDGARLIVRFHGVDSLSVWQFLIDWSRVSDVVFVSEHLRRAVLAHLGNRLTGVRQHVMGNAVDSGRFDGRSTASAHRTLGLVGWGQRVKDPLWAIDVLAELRSEEPSWRLKLIGADFPALPSRVSERKYAAAFRERALQPDVRSAITYVGYTHRLSSHLEDVGFALSTSLRESWHIGVMEMVAAEAVPVIRDWPVYRAHGGAASLVPPEWVVQTPADAAARIRSHADVTTWREAADSARHHVRDRFGTGSMAADYRRIILGVEPDDT